MSHVDQLHRRRGSWRVLGLFAGIVLMWVLAGCARTGGASGRPDATIGSDVGVTFGPDAGGADWWVSPADVPLSPDARVIHGFLQERACASGSSPEGRILGPAIEYGTDAIVVTFKVRGVAGFATCPSNPQFPIAIELTEALGARGVLDGGITPPRDATIDPTIVVAPDEDCGPLIGTGDAKIACIALISATLGDRYAEYAEVRVAPAEADCPGDICTEASAIEARTWIVGATDLRGIDIRWRCTYRDEVATSSRG
jgi:hypothetical protein